MYKPWVLDDNTLWVGADWRYQVISDTWGGVVQVTREVVNVVPYILCCDMDSYIQHLNALHNDYHAEYVDAPVNSGYRTV